VDASVSVVVAGDESVRVPNAIYDTGIYWYADWIPDDLN
jgi:hypothetical protein